MKTEIATLTFLEYPEFFLVEVESGIMIRKVQGYATEHERGKIDGYRPWTPSMDYYTSLANHALQVYVAAPIKGLPNIRHC